MTATEIQQLAEKHLAIWSERDVAKRKEWISEVYAADVEITDPSFLVNGPDGLNDLINDLQQKFPGYIFSVQKPVQSHHNVARLFWQYGPADNPAATTGQDILVVENGKIKTLYVFLDDAGN
ncbi:nuclear transport factor 2 family protein [Chitinophagaceae bacterium MMS25-I14]